MDASVAASSPKQEIKLSEYKAPDFALESVHLLFELYDDHAVVTATSEVSLQPEADGILRLDGGPFMELEEVAIDGNRLSADAYQLNEDALILSGLSDRFVLTVKTMLSPKENTRLEGLYFSGGNFTTQCEAEGFRHITYFPDRPDVLTKYTVRIEADQKSCPVLLSNGNLSKEGELEGGRHYAEWVDPYPKPSYLFALVAGDLSRKSGRFRTMSGRQVELNIYVRPDDLDKCDHAMQSLKNSMKWDEDVFGLEYDLDIYNIVAVSDFNMGAMENKGLNIFNTKCVLASPDTATDSDFDIVEGVIGHEYFHNWTGNRVTCRDWFQLSLKEGLTVFRDQEFSSDMGSRAVKRLDDVRLLRMLQFPEDAGPLAHPVRPEKYIEINNFYTATVYNKGAEVIRMMHRLIGADAFLRGMKEYFDRHDGQAVTCDDFVSAMEHASGVDLGQFRLWYSQAGTPVVRVERERDGDDVILTLEQSCPPTPGQPLKKPLHLPVSVAWVVDEQGLAETVSLEGAETVDGSSFLLQLTEARQSFRFKSVPKGAVPSLLRGFTAPVTLTHDLSREELSCLVKNDSDPFARWEAAQELFGGYILDDAAGERASTSLPELVTSAFTRLLNDKSTDKALLAELLALPSEIALGQKQAVLTPNRLHASREEMSLALAQANKEAMLELYARLEAEEFQLTPDAKAKRRLRNLLLGYIARLDGGDNLVRDHYRTAGNMTDRMAALQIIAGSHFSFREDLLAEFYETWRHNDLVIDKWFAVQAQSKRTDTIARVEQLCLHEGFKITNPNRLRSVVSSFAIGNQVRFHQADGAGYRFLADMIVKADRVNPQTAARLVSPLGRWGRVDPVRETAMKDALKRIQAESSLSDDVRELVEKSLS